MLSLAKHLGFRNALRLLWQSLDSLPLVIAARIVSVSLALAIRETGIPPAASICIISDLPERGSPETIVITRRHSPLSAASIR